MIFHFFVVFFLFSVRHKKEKEGISLGSPSGDLQLCTKLLAMGCRCKECGG